MTTPAYTSPTDGLDAREWLRLIRRRGWIMLVCLLLIPLAAYQLTASRPKVFEAQTIVQVEAPDASGLGPEFAAPTTNVQAIAGFVETSAVAEEAARRLGVPTRDVAGRARATADDDTGFITISAGAPTGARAVAIANAYAEALNATRAERGRERVGKAIANTQENLRRTPRTDIAGRAELNSQLQRLRTLAEAQSQNLQVLQPASSATQIAPHPRRNATVAILLALLVGAALILLAERADRKLRRPEDVETWTGLPFLGTIPHEAFPGEDGDREVAEAFQTLRNTLTYFNADETLRSLIITSGLKGEGKTTVAVNLALAYANLGKRVILVDTDLRKPDVARRLGLSERPGLSNLLVGATSLEYCLREVGSTGHGLRVLPAGPIPPNASALLGSRRMASLLDELRADCDILILDTTPLLMVSDAFPLLNKVSGIVALARLNKTPRDAIVRMAQIMNSADGRVLGMVATDARHGALGGYGYGYGYGYGAERQKEAESERSVQS